MTDQLWLQEGQRFQGESGAWYRHLDVLGAGGNAVTSLSVATSGPYRGVPFAVKLFRRRSLPERREAFLRETDFLRTCNHPSILRVFDKGLYESEHPFLVAEYMPTTLAQEMRRGRLRLVDKLSFTLQLLSALESLSNQSPPAVHRDVKPSNIFVKGRSCVLGDFGLLKRLPISDADDAADFKESTGAGMPFRYRSPDQVAYLNYGTPLTPASDVFQLGLVVTELFTGRNPQRTAANYADPVAMDDRFPFVPGRQFGREIKDLLQDMLKFRPADRPRPAQLLTAWEGIFGAAAKASLALEGSAF